MFVSNYVRIVIISLVIVAAAHSLAEGIPQIEVHCTDISSKISDDLLPGLLPQLAPDRLNDYRGQGYAYLYAAQECKDANSPYNAKGLDLIILTKHEMHLRRDYLGFSVPAEVRVFGAFEDLEGLFRQPVIATGTIGRLNNESGSIRLEIQSSRFQSSDEALAIVLGNADWWNVLDGGAAPQGW